jgi:hypothetical protein
MPRSTSITTTMGNEKQDIPAGAELGPARVALRVSVVFLAVYLVTWGGHYTSGDGAHKVAWAKSMLHLPGGGESMYGVGHSLLAIPPILVSTLLRNKFGIHSEAALYTLIFVLNGALLMGLIAYYLSHFYPSKRVWMTVAVIGLATTWWPYTKLDFSEPLVLTLLFAGFVTMRFGRPVLGSFVASFAITLREDAALLVGLLLIWHVFASQEFPIAKNEEDIRSDRRPLTGIVNAALHRTRIVFSSASELFNNLKLVLATVPALAIVMSANWARYGSVFDRGYSKQTFSNPFLVGIYGILFSAGKSVFLFSPPLILGVICWNRFRRRLSGDAWFFLGVFVIQAVEFAKWWDWSSDDAWGVRFMVAAVILMCIPLVEARRLSSVLLVAAVGVGIQLLPVLVGGLDYLMLVRQEQSHRRALYVDGVNRVDFEDVRFNPQYGQINGSWLMLRSMLGIPPRRSDSAETGTSLYDAFAPEAWRKSQWDFIWVRRKNGQ